MKQAASIHDTKGGARRLAAHLKAAHNLPISHSQALHAVAAMHGYPNWQTYLATCGAPDKSFPAGRTPEVVLHLPFHHARHDARLLLNEGNHAQIDSLIALHTAAYSRRLGVMTDFSEHRALCDSVMRPVWEAAAKAERLPTGHAAVSSWQIEDAFLDRLERRLAARIVEGIAELFAQLLATNTPPLLKGQQMRELLSDALAQDGAAKSGVALLDAGLMVGQLRFAADTVNEAHLRVSLEDGEHMWAARASALATAMWELLCADPAMSHDESIDLIVSCDLKKLLPLAVSTPRSIEMQAAQFRLQLVLKAFPSSKINWEKFEYTETYGTHFAFVAMQIARLMSRTDKN